MDGKRVCKHYMKGEGTYCPINTQLECVSRPKGDLNEAPRWCDEDYRSIKDNNPCPYWAAPEGMVLKRFCSNKKCISKNPDGLCLYDGHCGVHIPHVLTLPNDVEKEDNDNKDAPVASLISETCDSIKAMLLEKNKAYGNSALDPVRIFSRADAQEQLRVRIDDKLSRLQRGQDAGEDTIMDLIGYLILLQVAKGKEKAS